jgi:hypothetical protein
MPDPFTARHWGDGLHHHSATATARASTVLVPPIPLRTLDSEMRNEGTQEGKKAERNHEDEDTQEEKFNRSF